MDSQRNDFGTGVNQTSTKATAKKKWVEQGVAKLANLGWITRLEAIDNASQNFFNDATLKNLGDWGKAINDSNAEAGEDKKRLEYLAAHREYVIRLHQIIYARLNPNKNNIRDNKETWENAHKYLQDNIEGIDEQKNFPGLRKLKQLSLNDGVNKNKMKFFGSLVNEFNELQKTKKPSMFACFALFCCKPKRQEEQERLVVRAAPQFIL